MSELINVLMCQCANDPVRSANGLMLIVEIKHPSTIRIETRTEHCSLSTKLMC
jgi:hypothetical protein